MVLKYLATPLRVEGWEETLLNDANGNTLALMLNGGQEHGDNALAAVQEANAPFSAAPEMLAALIEAATSLEYACTALEAPAASTIRANLADCLAAIAKATGA